ncbi:LPXTG cell wall anchor domain-containing protein [Lactiplantibacillus plantarum]
MKQNNHQKQNTLPQTDEKPNNPLITHTLLALMGLLSLFGFKKKDKKS